MINDLVLTHTTRGTRHAAKALLQELRLQRRHKAALRSARKYRGKSGLRLNLGSGPNPKPGWVNIDLFEPADLQLDIREKFPFDDGSCSVIYSEHVFEHFAYPAETGHLLREALRVLEPGGRFDVGVPDTVWPLKSFVNGEDEFFRICLEKGWHPAWCTTRMHQINYHFRQGTEHKYAWDYETLAEVLRTAGFVRPERREFDPEIDAESRRIGTLYMRAWKDR